MITYSRKVEKQGDGTYLVGLCGEDEDGRVSNVWKSYATKPTLAGFKKDFREPERDDRDLPIPGSSLKEQLDAQLSKMAGQTETKDETPKDNKVTFS